MSPRPSRLAGLLAGLLSAPLAAGTEAPANEPAADERRSIVEEIVVTGSRVRRKDLATPAPVTVITREQVAESGKLTVGEILQALPAQGNALNAQHNMTGDGSVTVNLRALGEARTLVLVNGRRVVGGGNTVAGVVDLGAIPASAVERIEVLKDGASAVYGSDAIAGVVNVITRRRWTGTEVAAQAGTSSRGDGTTWDLSATTGASGDRGSLLLSLGFSDQKPVWAADRAWTSGIYGLDYRTRTPVFTGSTATPAGTFDLDTAACGPSPTPACQALIDAGYTGAASRPFFVVDPSRPGGARAYTAADAYNFEPHNYLSTPARRLSLYTAGEAPLGSWARAFLEGSFVNRRSDQLIAPAVLFTYPRLTLSAQSYFNPYGVDLTDVGRRMVEFGRRNYRQELGTFRAVVGLDGTLPGAAGPLRGWSWEASLNHGRTNGTTSAQGSLRAPPLQAAIGPSFRDPADGAVKCGTPGAVVAGCVPLDLLGGPGSISPQQVASLGFYGVDRVVNQLTAVQVNVGGELFRLLSPRPAGLALGYEWRRVAGEYRPNPISEAGEDVQVNTKATAGSYGVHEAYAELSLPIASGLPLLEEMEASLAGRLFDYSTFGADRTYKAGLRWKPVRDLTLRGTWSTAFRAPSVPELYLGATESGITVTDPCTDAGMTPGSTLDQRCAAAGVPLNAAGLHQTSDVGGTHREQLGGNPDLRPETARIYTVGLVLAPAFLRGLTIALDYYDVEVDHAIGAPSAAVILATCYAGSGNLCDLVHRGPAASGGKIDYIDDRTANLGGLRSAGLDFAARYDLATGAGQFRLTLDGTYLRKLDTLQVDGRVIRNAGNYDQLIAVPRWKGNAGATWRLGPLGAGLLVRYVGGYRECATADGVSNMGALCSDGTLDPTTGTQLSHQIAAWHAWDAFVRYERSSSLGRTALTLGVSNLLDRNPPTVYNNGTYQSDPSTYEFMGRFGWVRLVHAY